MDTAQIANFIVSAISLIGLWVIFHWPYRAYRVDLLRDRDEAGSGDGFS